MQDYISYSNTVILNAKQMRFYHVLHLCGSKFQFNWYEDEKLINDGRGWEEWITHYDDVMMSAMASQITSLTIAYSGVYSGADQRKHQSSASLAFVRGILYIIDSLRNQVMCRCDIFLFYQPGQAVEKLLSVEVWEWISYFITHFIGRVVIYLC